VGDEHAFGGDQKSKSLPNFGDRFDEILEEVEGDLAGDHTGQQGISGIAGMDKREPVYGEDQLVLGTAERFRPERYSFGEYVLSGNFVIDAHPRAFLALGKGCSGIVT